MTDQDHAKIVREAKKGKYPCVPKEFLGGWGGGTGIMMCAKCGHYPPPECEDEEPTP